MDDINFECTACGKCCHDLRLPLTLDEADAWLARGGRMELLCEAIPWPVEPEPGNEQAAYKKARSAAAMSGTLPVRVSVLLVGAFAGPCPNLGADMRCRIYAERPMVCRIYPAEINPFVALAPENKQCPPEAWQHGALLRHGVLVDETTRELVGESRRASEREAVARVRLCEVLGVDEAALANEGFVVYAPDSDVLRSAIQVVREGAVVEVGDLATTWRFVSNRAVTVQTLLSVGAYGRVFDPMAHGHLRYLGFFADEVG
ncbi:YkgJ family cysteine cluster protein [Paraburkholderia sp. D15]|uniref:YkgJ family cysteine cluster protein n=1 Tax=Paraburkholderia sp. D15 TaxID=2880218 RepID=UPI002479A1FF|nr:YkgJ family cysteine cluster protein [Paraburkholderia sp. D15]WGS53145.1 YkgJ family cysteine cluster protein [Paraburkholderia sp. D15]